MICKKFLKELNLIGRKLVEKDLDKFHYFPQQKERYIKTYNLIENLVTKNDRILDIGCSPFHFTVCLKRMGYDITGIDKEPKKSKEFLSGESLIVKKCDIEKEKLPFDKESFDKIIFLEVFEHLYTNPLFTLNEIRRVLKKEGKLIMTTPNAYSPKRIIHFLLGKGTGDDPYEVYNLLNLLGYYGHVKEYGIKELRKLLKKMGFEIEKVYFTYSGPYKFRNRPLKRSLARAVYKIFYYFRPSITIIAKKIKNI